MTIWIVDSAWNNEQPLDALVAEALPAADARELEAAQ